MGRRFLLAVAYSGFALACGAFGTASTSNEDAGTDATTSDAQPPPAPPEPLPPDIVDAGPPPVRSCAVGAAAFGDPDSTPFAQLAGAFADRSPSVTADELHVYFAR